MIAFKMSRFGIALLLAVLVSAAPPRASAQRAQRQPTPNDTLKSTEVASDRKVTFRIYAPKADEVSVCGDFGQGGKMTKDEQGVWSITVGPLTPDFYSYTFNVDGVRTVDPKNADDQAGHHQPGQHVPRARARRRTSRPRETCPHGEVRAAWYRSGTLDMPRRMHVYTPPGYEGGTRASTRSSTCCTAAATRTRAGARSAGPASSSTI